MAETIELGDVDEWLTAPVAQAARLIRLAPPEAFDAAPAGLEPASDS